MTCAFVVCAYDLINIKYNKHMNEYIEAKAADFTKAIDFFKKEIASIRTGRANPNMLEGVMVDAYGAKTR